MLSPRHARDQRRAIWPPEPGTFVLGLVRGAWRVPCRIVHDDDGWHAEIDGVVHPAHRDPALAYMVDAVWHGGTLVAQPDYDWFVAIKVWAQINDPSHPCLNPRKVIDPSLLKPIFHAAQ